MRPFNQNRQLNLYATPPHECGYIDDQQAITVFLDPHFAKDRHIYTHLTEQGFRRSGEHLYRPHCENCSACISVRVPIHAFVPSRSQKRVWKKNQDINVIAVTPTFQQSHFELYAGYIHQRHLGAGMDNPTPESYMAFLTSDWSDTVFYEFYLDNVLIGVAVVDRLENALSAVYTFFDSRYASRSLGTFAILWEIKEARRLQLDWLYLGYWIESCQRMAYKSNYKPLQYYKNGQWNMQLKSCS